MPITFKQWRHLMRIDEVVGGDIKSFVAVVRCVVDGMGSASSRIQIRCDGLNQARYLLTRCYGVSG
jgi:hypothetical protein